VLHFTFVYVRRKRKLLIGAVACALVAGVGGAIGATQLGSSGGVGDQAVIADAAKQLGVEPAKLSDALKKALSNQVDALVAAGRLSKDEGDALKARIQSGEVPLLGGRFGFGHFGPDRFGGVAGLDTAASYLGLSAEDLRSELASGKTLAQVAQEHGKSADGLVSALADAAKKKLDAAVAAGRLTQAQEDSILADLKQRITDLVSGTRPPQFDHGFRFGGDHLWRHQSSLHGPTA
jgi:uncharacterized protein YidB (DUF937 family)